MRCGKCQHEILPGTKFCNHCGWEVVESTPVLEMTKKCPSCNADMKTDAAFCPSCGAPSVAAAPYVPETPIMRETVIVEKKTRSNLPVIILSIALVLALALGGFALYMYLKKPSDNTSSQDREEQTYDENEEKQTAGSPEEEPEVKEEPEEEPVEEPEVKEEPEEEPEDTYEYGKDNSYLFPSDRRYITYGDLYGLSQAQVALIRNEIYARHGYVFQTEPYISYFKSKAWYSPNNPNFTEAEFSSIEKANKEFIVEFEKENGWR